MKRKEIEKQATESEINIDKRICGQAENGKFVIAIVIVTHQKWCEIVDLGK